MSRETVKNFVQKRSRHQQKAAEGDICPRPSKLALEIKRHLQQLRYKSASQCFEQTCKQYPQYFTGFSVIKGHIKENAEQML